MEKSAITGGERNVVDFRKPVLIHVEKMLMMHKKSDINKIILKSRK